MNNHEKYILIIWALIFTGISILLCSYLYVTNIRCPKEQVLCGILSIIINIGTAIFFYFLGLISQLRSTEHEYIDEFHHIMPVLLKCEKRKYSYLNRNKESYKGMTKKEWILSSNTNIFIAINDWSSRVYYDLMRSRIDGKYIYNKTYSQLSSLINRYLSTIHSMKSRSSAHYFPRGSYYDFYSPIRLITKLKQFRN